MQRLKLNDFHIQSFVSNVNFSFYSQIRSNIFKRGTFELINT